MKLVSALVALVASITFAGCAVQTDGPSQTTATSENAAQTGEAIIKNHGDSPPPPTPVVCPAAQGASLDEDTPPTFFELAADINGLCATIRYSDSTGLYTMSAFTNADFPGLCLYGGGVNQLQATPLQASMVCPINQQGLPWGYSHNELPASHWHHDTHTTCHGCTVVSVPQ